MQAYENGYADERFQHPVGHTFHCCICTNVIKDPVMCGPNEHIFCRACITRHLMNSQTCPSCMKPLTVDTLSQATRTVTNLLSELKISCEFAHRGCGMFVELGDLERHVRECGFAPAVCSNEGCKLEVNKRDLLHHETAECDARRVECHSCNDIRQEMDIVKVNLAAMNVKLGQIDEKMDRNEKNFERKLDRSDKKLDRNEAKFENVQTVMENVVAKVELVQEQLNKQEESNRRIEADNEVMKKSLNEITKQLERMTQRTSHEVQAEQEQMKKGIAEADEVVREPKVVIAGGWNGKETLNSVEMFSLSNGTWTRLQSIKERRSRASSVVYNNQIFVSGGLVIDGGTKSMEKLSMNAVEADQSITWGTFLAELPGRLSGHCSVVYNGRLIIIGGFDMDTYECSDNITKVSLVPPYTKKLLATMPQRKCHHGVASFGDQVLILGGSKDLSCRANFRTVLLYDITNNECKQLAPLPYPVSEMATVKWDDDNVIIMGGVDNESLNKVFMYNVKTQKIRMLPDMKYKRQGCVAAVVRDTVIVMGGNDGKGNCLKSVECFRFDRNTWKELPQMHEARWTATAVVC